MSKDVEPNILEEKETTLPSQGDGSVPLHNGDLPRASDDGVQLKDMNGEITANIQSPNVDAPPDMSKSQMKKLKRKQQWEEGRPYRKLQRKQKIKARKQRRLEVQQQEVDPKSRTKDADASDPRRRKRPSKSTQLPVTIIIDCQFDELMMEKEIVSLGSQLTRAYSDNRKASYCTHLAVSSFNGNLKSRFENILEGCHESWKGVRFRQDHFVKVADEAKAWMTHPKGGKLAGMLAKTHGQSTNGGDTAADGLNTGEVVYLTSESPNTLHELKPYSTYILGGLVDKNRHKGECYKRAMDHGVQTARLPISDLIQMPSRAVLATNHVNEIVLRWLECGDWAEAFTRVIPKRKGGTLRNSIESPQGEKSDNEQDALDT